MHIKRNNTPKITKACETDALAMRPSQPFIVRRDEKELHVRIAHMRDDTAHALLLRVEDFALNLQKLSSVGLGSRATAVLYWLAKGKTNLGAFN